MNRTVLRRIVRGAVLVFSIFCFVWVLRPIFTHLGDLRSSTDGPALLGGVALASLLYTLLLVLLALAWWWVVGIYGQAATFRTGYVVFARSQIGKYLPGNVFHFAGRQVLGREAGWTHPALVASVFLEMGSLLFAAVLLGAGGLLTSRLSESLMGLLPWIVLCGAGCLLVWPVVDGVLRRLPKTASLMSDLPRLGVRASLKILGPSVLTHGLFFAGTGSLLVMLMASAWGTPPADAWNLLWIFPVAWAAGTIAVGAPAGVGVREAVLMLQLEPLLGPARAAALSVALRLVTTAGDALTAAVGWWLGRASRDPENA